MNATAAKKHVLLLGASGFIGKAVYHLLKMNTGIELSILLRKPDADIFEGNIYYGDITNFDWQKLKHPPQVVVHLARISSKKWARPGRLLAAWKGYFANKRLLRYISGNENFEKIIYVSGSLMYGNSSRPLDERSKLSPISFAREYIKAELPFIKMLQFQPAKICMLRVPWVVGRGSWLQAFFLNYIQQQQQVPQYGDGKHLMTFIALSDLARCIAALCSLPFNGVLHAVAEAQSTQVDFCRLLSSMLSLPVVRLSLGHQENAVQEAFTSDIPLVSSYNVLKPYIQCQTLRDILEQELFLLKHI